MQRKLRRDAFSATSCHHLEIETMGSRGLEDKVIFVLLILYILKSASNLNDNLNCSKELEHYAS